MIKATASVTMAAFLLAACQTTTPGLGVRQTSAEHYPQCYAPIAQLHEADKRFQQQLATNVVAGAILGAVLLGALAAAAGGNRNSTVGAAAAGAALGGAAGYGMAQHQRQAEDQQRLATYINDIDTDIGQLTGAKAAASSASRCYRQQFDKLIADVKRSRIDQAEARARFAEIQSGTSEASSVLGRIESGAANRLAQYQQAQAGVALASRANSMQNSVAQITQERTNIDAQIALQRQLAAQNGLA
jgi:uncharacterized protein YcfJ